MNAIYSNNYEYIKGLACESPDWVHAQIAADLTMRDVYIRELRAEFKKLRSVILRDNPQMDLFYDQ